MLAEVDGKGAQVTGADQQGFATNGFYIASQTAVLLLLDEFKRQTVTTPRGVVIDFRVDRARLELFIEYNEACGSEACCQRVGDAAPHAFQVNEIVFQGEIQIK